jgi:hypothetical protein
MRTTLVSALFRQFGSCFGLFDIVIYLSLAVKLHVVIDDGKMEANINIDLIDDSLMEYAEQFTITIDSILGNTVN